MPNVFDTLTTLTIFDLGRLVKQMGLLLRGKTSSCRWVPVELPYQNYMIVH